MGEPELRARLDIPELTPYALAVRVGSGIERGMRLRYPGRPGTRPLRPTRNKVKQAIVNALRARIPGARVCELFAGTGALGIELLSAGAGSVVFVEQDRRTVRCLRENLARFGDRAQVVAGDVRRVISRLVGPFDIVLADPPYGLGLNALTEELVAEHGLLAADGILVVEHGRRDEAEIPPGLSLVRCYRYGDTLVSVFRSVDGQVDIPLGKIGTVQSQRGQSLFSEAEKRDSPHSEKG